MPDTALPADTHLAYIVRHEAWYAATAMTVDRPGISVMASAKGTGGGVAWDFTVEEHDIGRNPALRVDIFDDAFAAWTQIPEFFTALAELGEAATLDRVRNILDELGAVTVTREDGWWMVAVPEHDLLTQARHYSEIETMARSVIAMSLDVPADSFDMAVTVAARAAGEHDE